MLGDIVDRVNQAGLKSPAIIIVGEVVNLRETMNWFEGRPLLGKRIVITRAREQASDLVRCLSDLGAECIECPTIKIEPPPDVKPLEDAVERIDTYDWIIFTSVNGVNFFFKALFRQNKDARALGRIRTACIGPATAAKLLEFGVNSDIIPNSYRAESVVEVFETEQLNGKKILIPRAKEARPILPVELKKMGALVNEVCAYRTSAVDKAGLLLSRLADKTIDMVTFTSSSTVNNFKSMIPLEQFETLIKGIAVASIGPITEQTAKDLGFEVHITAETFTIPGLCDAIVTYYQPSAKQA